MTFEDPSLIGLAAALGCGLLIGIERERRKGRGGSAIAGARTFTIAALAGALAQWLAQPLLVALGGALVLGLVVVGYWRDRDADRGITTELALFVTYLLGVTAMVNAGMSAAGGVIVAALLATRSQLHRFATVSLSEAELRDALILGGAALVVLPLIPSHPVAWLGEVDLRRVWMLVVILLSLQAAGHVAIRLLGPGPGLVVSGFVSGFISSAATFAAMGVRCRQQPSAARAALAGAIASNLATLVLMAVVLVSASPVLLRTFWPCLAGGALVTLVQVALVRRAGGRTHGVAAAVAASAGPAGAGPGDAGGAGPVFSLLPSLGFALTLTLVTSVVSLANTRFGETGAMLGATLAGFADVHAATASLASLVAGGRISAPAAVVPVLLAFLANSTSKALAAFGGGGLAFGWRAALALLSLQAGLWLPWWLLRP